MPIWFLSGAFFPATDAPRCSAGSMQLDPLTYGLAALRRWLYLGAAVPADLPSLGLSLTVAVVFGMVTFIAATAVAERSGTL